MSNKKDKPEFEIEVVNDTPVTSDGDSINKCICTTEDGRSISCVLHGG
jgi:hypothetical protein|tara:strand:+ start:670 stop:813 length:144 start_codon:yes stop_codon:yes gene_type:complete